MSKPLIGYEPNRWGSASCNCCRKPAVTMLSLGIEHDPKSSQSQSSSLCLDCVKEIARVTEAEITRLTASALIDAEALVTW